MAKGSFPDKQQISCMIRQISRRYPVPGLAIGIQHQKHPFIYYEGITNLDAPQPVDAHSLFQIGSITKTFTALALLLLLQDASIDLDTPIIDILHDFSMSDEYVTKNATIRHLLTHTGGWEGDCFDCPDSEDAPLKDLMPRLAQLPQITPLGQIWSYNSVGFCIAGRIIEVLSGLSYEQAIKKLVLEPLQMHDAAFSPDESYAVRLAAGHQVSETGQLQVMDNWLLPRSLRPSGGLICSIHDMIRYARFLLDDRNDRCKDLACHLTTRNSLYEFQFPASGKADAVGLSWMLRYAQGIKIVRHGGVTLGQCSEIMLIPELDFALVILLNSNNGQDLIDDLVQTILKVYFNIAFLEPDPISIDRDSLSLFEGCYVSLSNDIDIFVDHDELRVTYHYKPVLKHQKFVPAAPPPMHAYFIAKNRAIIRENHVVCDFLTDQSGQIAYLRHGNKVHPKRMQSY
jgi:CubicO group peptidase (beta-lactamase class C family)